MKFRFITLIAIIFSIAIISCEDDDASNTAVGIVSLSHDKLVEIENATIPLGVNIGIENYNHAGGIVSIAITGGTYGVDYETSAGSAAFDIEIAENTLLTKFSIIPIDNDELDGNRELNIAISEVVGSLELGTRTSMKFTILDDDKPVVGAVSFENESLSVDENASEALQMKLILDQPSTYGGNVEIHSAGTAVLGTDYSIEGVSSETFTIAVAPGITEVSIPLMPIDNTEYEEDKSVGFEIVEVSGGLSLGSPLVSTVVINNDDAPEYPLIELELTEIAAHETTGTLTLKALLSKVLEVEGSFDIEVSGTATIGSDYTVNTSASSPITVVIPANQLETTFTVEITDDSDTEELETAVLTIAAASEGIEIGAQKSVSITIEDDDPAFIPFTYLEDFESTSSIDDLGYQTILIGQDPGFPAGDVLKYNKKAGSYTDAADISGTSDAGIQCFHKTSNGAGVLDNMVVTPKLEASGPLNISVDVSYVTGLDKNNTTVTYYYSETYNGSGAFNEADWTVLGTDTAQEMDAAGYARLGWKRNTWSVEATGPVYIAVRVYQFMDDTYATSQWRFDNIKVTNE